MGGSLDAHCCNPENWNPEAGCAVDAHLSEPGPPYSSYGVAIDAGSWVIANSQHDSLVAASDLILTPKEAEAQKLSLSRDSDQGSWTDPLAEPTTDELKPVTENQKLSALCKFSGVEERDCWAPHPLPEPMAKELGPRLGAFGACCRVQHDVRDMNLSLQPPMESLSYQPLRFDVSHWQTIDVERSSTRYAKILGYNSPHGWVKQRSPECTGWMQNAELGQQITLLTPQPQAVDERLLCLENIPGMFVLDAEATMITIHLDSVILSIPVDKIQVICPAMDVPNISFDLERGLEEEERDKSVLIQYVGDNGERLRLCFLEESAQAKERFIQALSTIWFEKRNALDMWL